ncbi:MAG: hypothetical protein Q9190_000254 [Brigantiaea leucoxantha]
MRKSDSQTFPERADSRIPIKDRTKKTEGRSSRADRTEAVKMLESSRLHEMALDKSHAIYHPDVSSGEAMIGIALGSPHQDPVQFLPEEQDTQNTHEYLNSFASTSQTPRRQENKKKPTYEKSGRWRVFGGGFGLRGFVHPSSALPLHGQSGKQQGSRSSFLRSRQGRPSYEKDSLYLGNGSALSSPQYGSAPPRISSDTASKIQSSKATGIQRKVSLRRRLFSELRPEASAASEGRTLRQAAESHQENTGTDGLGWDHNNPRTHGDRKLQLEPGPLLQIEIPSVELERYSVMFSSVLQPTRQPSPKPQAQPQPSLLSRRRDRLERLGAISDPSFKESLNVGDFSGASQRTTSRSPVRSSSLALHHSSSPARPGNSPLHRSATTSSGNLSPSRAGFEFFDTDKNQSQVFMMVSAPQPRSKSPLAQSQSSSSSSPRAAAASPLEKSNSKATATDPLLKKAAEISIARQISISERQQRRLLVPAGH